MSVGRRILWNVFGIGVPAYVVVHLAQGGLTTVEMFMSMFLVLGANLCGFYEGREE